MTKVGIVGSGQLGLMLCEAAQKLNIQTVVYSPQKDAPAVTAATKTVIGAYDDLKALQTFAESVDLITFEFENIPIETLKHLAKEVPVFPAPETLFIKQNRLREKNYLKENGLPVADFLPVKSVSDLEAAVTKLGYPLILKTAGFGYDGKGQQKIKNAEDLIALKKTFKDSEYILEKMIPFEREVSILAARNQKGEMIFYPLIENLHQNHILHSSACPATDSDFLQEQAEVIATRLLESLDYVGLLCIELFVLKGELIINEFSPRVHNSGHLTIEAFATSQFEQHLRAITNMSFGSAEQKSEAVMINLLGDLWQHGQPDFGQYQSNPKAFLHLYGKEPRPGRKVGHVTVLQ
jgi:5-(carboxyamino)imidazole ribonucleotide synthase